jgi:2-hydroxymuconate-semialdehyde hydrolase
MPYQDKSFSLDGVPVHYIEAGAGFPLLLIHGSGPGASTIGNWRLILEPLAERYHVFAMDLIGFGRSGRRPVEPYFSVPYWLSQCQAMLGLMPEKLGVIAHSLSAALGLKLAAANPDQVAAILTTGAMGADFPANDATKKCWNFPETRADLRAVAEILIHDHRHITDAYIENRVQTLFNDPDYKAYFSAMFSGDRQRFITESLLTPAELAAIKIPVTMLHGRNDHAFPASTSLKLAESLPQADITLLANCSHSIALEQTEKLLTAARALFG